jgi:multiple sugar transport system permease protein
MAQTKLSDWLLTRQFPIYRWKRYFTVFMGYLGVVVVGLFFFIPWVWLLSSSLKTADHIFDLPPAWIPNPAELSNYVNAITNIPFFMYMKNTVLICALVVIGRLFSCSLVAYGFSQVRWPGRDKVFILVLATMMLPFQVTMIPLYVIFSHLNLIDTIIPLILPAFFGNAFFIFLLRQFFMTIPRELIEAALLDGANHFNIYTQIVIPLSKPALSTLALFSFLWTYTDYMAPLIYLIHEPNWTLTLGLRGFLSQHTASWGPLLAACVLFTIPVVILFFFTQKTFIEGIVTTGLR